MVNDTPFLPTWSTLTSIPTSCSRAITNYLWSSFFCGYMRWNSRNNSNNNRSSNNNTHNKNITQCFYMLIFKRPLRLFSNIPHLGIDSKVVFNIITKDIVIFNAASLVIANSQRSWLHNWLSSFWLMLLVSQKPFGPVIIIFYLILWENWRYKFIDGWDSW